MLFVGGITAGVGGFVYHAVAAHLLGRALYGEVAVLVAVYAVGTAVNLILILVLARYASTLLTRGSPGGIRYLIVRTHAVVAVPALVFVGLMAALSVPIQQFLKLDSPIPVIWLGLAIAAIWFVAIPRGTLQGTQHFPALSTNLGLEIIVRTGTLVPLLLFGLAVNGSMIAILLGCTVAYVAGMWSLRDYRAMVPERARLRAMFSFSLTAAAGTIGVLLLYNLDVVLAKHYLNVDEGGLYGSLNKVGTILYFGTLSVSQVLFPRVVEAVSTNRHPGRLLLLSGAITAFLGACAIVVFALASRLIVLVLFGPQFLDDQPLILAMGFIGLGLSLVNLLVQFFMAVHDRLFIPLLAAGCLVEAVLIVVRHPTVAAVVLDVMVAIFALFCLLMVRAVLLMPKLRPDMVVEEDAAAL